MNTPKNQNETLFDIFKNVSEVDEEIFTHIIDMFRKENISDSIQYLSIEVNQRHLQSSIIELKNQSNAVEGQKLEALGKDIKIIFNTLKKIKDNDFNLKDFSSEQYLVLKIDIMSKLEDNIYSSLNGSEFYGVDISGANFNGAQLFNCKWKNIKIHELNKLDGHTCDVQSVSFSPDGKTLASCSCDKSIRLWEVKTGQQKAKLEGHTSYVHSVCFSPDGITLASGSNDKSIRFWHVKTGQKLLTSHKSYIEILEKFNTPIFQNCSLPENVNYYTFLIIQQKLSFESQGALIFSGEFVNQTGIDLKTLLKQKGSYILENTFEKQQKQN
ncbi:unnamed protein product [Paramecium sonneborni]|uniref:WD-40 repeat protein n=1 Tax=Paramecium sonneborni TaxID=65129 RepID=A0A8S1R134_9CILI|nr:unnamed protein product [Paramecium sonneborni]